MNKLIFCIIILSFFHILCGFEEKTVFIGSIQFPSALELLPSLRIYYAGKKISTELDEDANRILFSIPEQKNRTLFYVVVTPKIKFVSNENTIEYLKLISGLPYKFYVIELNTTEEITQKKRVKFSLTSNDQLIPCSTNTKYSWTIKELTNLPAGRIPDETIIICFDPTYIQKLEGGNAIEFPRIVVKPDLLKLVGSEAKFHELSTKWFLAALDTDTIHEPPSSEIKFCTQSKTIVALVS